ncbi:MAG: hypothetical protein AB7F32_10085 [Victivallaceae bacterium]
MKILLLIFAFAIAGMAEEGKFLSQAELDAKITALKPGGAAAAGTVHPSRRGCGLSRIFQCANCGNPESVSWEKYTGNIDRLLSDIRRAGLQADFKPRLCKPCLFREWSRLNPSLFAENALMVSDSSTFLWGDFFRIPLKKGTLLTVKEISERGFLVAFPDSIRLYVRSDMISDTGKLLKRCNIRTGPGLNFESVTIAEAGQSLKIVPGEAANGWIAVTFPDDLCARIEGPWNLKLRDGSPIPKLPRSEEYWLITIDDQVREVEFFPYDVILLHNFFTCTNSACPDCGAWRSRLKELLGSVK